MKRFNKKEYNKMYYQKNKKYILHRKKLIRNGKEIPVLEKRHHDDRVVVVFGDIIIQVIRPC